MKKNILVTGGMGYIGSHVVTQLFAAGYQSIILDNLSNSDILTLKLISKITKSDPCFYQGDVRDEECLQKIFSNHRISAVIHFAGLKSVSESEKFALHYYDNNVNGTLNLLRVMGNFTVNKLVFSSSATVYGNSKTDGYSEDLALSPINVYGRTKAVVEQILNDLYHSESRWSIANLRYFNPVGAHSSGLIGENPRGIPNNLMPYIAQVASGRLSQLRVYGNDYPTPDGTGMRDYIHVEDLAVGHVLALQKILHSHELLTVNLGTGKPYSVLDVISCFEKVCGKKIPYQFAPRRNGDLSCYYANPRLAKILLGWSAQLDLEQMCADTWRYELARNSF